MKKIINIFITIFIFLPFTTFGAIPFPEVSSPDTKSKKTILTATHFPDSYKDTSFTTRLKSKHDGYKPFEDLSAYNNLIVADEMYHTEHDVARIKYEQQLDAETLSDEEYCEKYPLDDSRCPEGEPEEPTPPSNYTGQTIGGGPVIAKNDTYGGACYPADKRGAFEKKVLTSGKYETISPAFEKAMIILFRREGTCGEIPNDPGGFTCYGISTNGSGLSEDEVRNMTRPKAEDFYFERYWKKNGISTLPDVISGDVFLAGVLSGPVTAIRQFRRFLNLPDTNTIDDNVIQAVKNYNGDIHNDWLNVREAFLRDLAARQYNNTVLNGWMNQIKLKRRNGCHVIPVEPLYRN